MLLGLEQHNSSLCLCIHMAIILVCVWGGGGSKFNSPYKDTSQNGFGAHPNPVGPHLGLITSVKTLLPNKLTFIGSKFILNWGSTLANPVQCLFGKGDHRLTLRET